MVENDKIIRNFLRSDYILGQQVSLSLHHPQGDKIIKFCFIVEDKNFLEDEIPGGGGMASLRITLVSNGKPKVLKNWKKGSL